MIDRDRYTIGYRELRALVEELLNTSLDAQRTSLTAAIREHLRMHCHTCGDLIDPLPRRQGDAFCYACVAPGPATRKG